MKIYFAAPLFNQAEQEFNQKLTNKLEAIGSSVFLPQRDGVEKNKSPYDSMAPEVRRRKMFELDRDNILAADVFLFVLDGRIPDEGACVELGIAYMDKQQHPSKRLVGFMTDTRSAFIGSQLNPMISQALDEIATNQDQLIDILMHKN